jgi:glycosyltransferase involved in cell wall biosynthesis
MKNNQVSVLMPVYNGEKFIDTAIQSILNQTYKNFELIIVNDSSTDGTEKIVKAFKDVRIKYRKNKSRLGLAANRNAALSLATGKYIAILDADDYAHPSRLQEQVSLLLANKSCVICGSYAEVIDEHNTIINRWKFPLDATSLRGRFYIQFPLVHSSVMFRHSTVQKLMLDYDAKFSPSEDYDFCFKLLTVGEAQVIPRFLVRYRVHQQNSSKNSKSTVKSIIPRLYHREYKKIGCLFTFQENKDIAAFVNPYAASPDLLLQTYANLFKLLKVISKECSFNISHQLDWLLYVHKALILQLKNKLFQ